MSEGTESTNPTPVAKTFTQSELDAAISAAIRTREESIKAKLTPEIRSQLEAEAQMTAEQKYKVELEKLDSERRTVKKESNRVKAERLFAAKGIAESDYASILELAVSEDEETTLERASKVIGIIEAAASAKAQSEIIKAMKTPAVPEADKSAKIPSFDEWKSMTYDDQLKFKSDNPQLHQQFIAKRTKGV